MPFQSWLRCGVVSFLAAVSPLTAQVVTPGPALDLPAVISEVGQPHIVALPDGRFVLAGRQFNNLRSADLHLLTVQSNGDVFGPWDRRQVGDLEAGSHLLAASDQVLHLDVETRNPLSPERLTVQAIDPADGEESGPNIDLFLNPSPGPAQVDGASFGDGRSVAAWSLSGDNEGAAGVFAQVLDADGQPLGDLLEVADANASQVKVAAQTNGTFLVAWLERGRTGAWARPFDAQGNAGPIQQILLEVHSPNDLVLTRHVTVGFLVVWNSSRVDGVFARRIGSDGIPLNDNLFVSPNFDHVADQPAAAADSNGRIWIAWREPPGKIYLRSFLASAMGPVTIIPPRQEGMPQSRPNLAVGPDDNLLVTWNEGASRPTLEGRSVDISDACPVRPFELCLHEGRFQVRVSFTDFEGNHGQGRVVPFQSRDSGLFTFFNPANWEVMVKVIDGCDFNGFYWIFSAATTNLAYDLLVIDTVTGLRQTYSNPLGEPAPANTDTMALMSCGHGPP